MTSQHHTPPDLRALLIGIDCYLPNLLSDGTYYRSLSGCVRDISNVEQFLRAEFGLTDERLIRLTASRGNSGTSSRGSGGQPSLIGTDETPPEPREQWPTYQNIIAAFRKLEQSAQPGEQIYIHYSGHGGRVTTLPKHRKFITHKVLDEALVPTDLGADEGQYLRDIELAFLLKRLVAKGLYVTLVLDSCHSGSATRGEAVVVRGPIPAHKEDVRGSDRIDDRPKPSLVASDEELTDNWLQQTQPRKRDFSVGSGWLPDPQGYVLLAACRVHEGAHEHAFDGVNKQGALTYWLLESLRKFGDGATYRTLHQYIQAQVSGKFRGREQQNPQLEGEGDRIVFGRKQVQAPYAFVVREADEEKREVTLSAGRVHGLGAGARFALYDAGQVHIKRSDTPLAIAEILEPSTSSSLARLVNQTLNSQVKVGDQALLLVPGTDRPRYTVKVIVSDTTIPDVDKPGFEQLVNLLKGHNEGYVLLTEADETADFLITVDPRGHFTICDPAGTNIPNIGPALSAADPNAPQRVVNRLVHLAKYRSVHELQNYDPLSPMSRTLSVELKGVQVDYRPGIPPQPRPLADPSSTPTIKAGEWIFFHVRNNNPKGGPTFNLTVLDLRPDWSIRQVFPSRAGLFDNLEPERELLLPLRAELPRNYDEGIDLIKFFATIEPADFHFLELPPLEISSLGTLRSSESVSESQTRDMVAPLAESDDWNTKQFEIKVTRW